MVNARKFKLTHYGNSTIKIKSTKSKGNEDDGFDKEYNLKHVVNYEPITAIDKIKNWGKV